MHRARTLLAGRNAQTLHAPAAAKTVLRWAIRKRSRLAYIAFLSWPSALSFIALLYFAATAAPPAGMRWPWLITLELWAATLLAGLRLLERCRSLRRAWTRRR